MRAATRSTKKPRQSRKVRAQVPEEEVHLPDWVREAIGLALLGCAAFVLMSVYSYSPETDPAFFHEISPLPSTANNLGGPFGSYVASFLKESLGLGAYFVALLVAVTAVFVMGGKTLRLAPWKVPMGLISLLLVATLFSLTFSERPSPEQGGIVGNVAAQWLLANLNPGGSYLLVLLLLILSIIAFGEIALLGHLRNFCRAAGRWAVALGTSLSNGLQWSAGRLAFLLRRLYELSVAGSRRFAKGAKDLWTTLRQRSEAMIAQWRERLERKKEEREAVPEKEPEPKLEPLIVEKITTLPPESMASPPPAPDASAPQQPKIVSREENKKKAEQEGRASTTKERLNLVQAPLPFPDPIPKAYRPPPLVLLDDPDMLETSVDTAALLEKAKTLENKLKDFNINGRVTEVHPGPIITLFEYEPAPGIKVNKIANMADDLSMAMAAISIRIVAPIPGKSVVGIEVPNEKRQTVMLKDILGSPDFLSRRHKLPLALGKDISGNPVTTDLARMPHLLIAGATGTGKSVSLHSLILSLLFRFSPEDVRFLMIDPKMIELAAYHGIPHLLHPVITDVRRAPDVLEWAVTRMEQRYQLLSEKGARNIESYNQRIEKEMAQALREGNPEELEAGASEGSRTTDEDDGILPEQGKLPYLILVIDEMADLMIVSGRLIEESIIRLAQKARAAGIHLLLATQRPSVDVLTGIIKANLPTRISFQVSSRTDSRTILDSMGAEKLLGQGDMLFLPPGTSRIRRIHGAYVTEPEIERVVEYMKQFGKPKYEKIPFRAQKSKDSDEVFDHDEKYDEAVFIVAQSRQASISMLQRKLRVGYNRAARMIEQMEQEGIVGPQEGVKPREVLVEKLDAPEPRPSP